MSNETVEAMARAMYEQIHDEGQMTCTSWDSDEPVMESVRAGWLRRAGAAFGAVPALHVEAMGRHDERGLDHLAEAEAAWVARDAMEERLTEALTRVLDLRVALCECADELDRHGWGDMHYGDQPQERSVVAAVELARATLGDAEPLLRAISPSDFGSPRA